MLIVPEEKKQLQASNYIMLFRIGRTNFAQSLFVILTKKTVPGNKDFVIV